jgi:hypothetical protein
VLKDSGKSGARAMEWGELRRYGIAWHRQRGIDFSAANRRLAKLIDNK